MIFRLLLQMHRISNKHQQNRRVWSSDLLRHSIQGLMYSHIWHSNSRVSNWAYNFVFSETFAEKPFNVHFTSAHFHTLDWLVTKCLAVPFKVCTTQGKLWNARHTQLWHWKLRSDNDLFSLLPRNSDVNWEPQKLANNRIQPNDWQNPYLKHCPQSCNQCIQRQTAGTDTGLRFKIETFTK